MANVLQYRHEFSNMYHSISQVVYYNNTSYVRRRQLPLAELCKCEQPVHVLPLFCLIRPSLLVYKEDETLPAGFAVPGSYDTDTTNEVNQVNDKGIVNDVVWAWLMLPGRIYLVSNRGHLYYSSNMIPLFNLVETHESHSDKGEGT
jgi:hypothetical protein